MQTLKKIIFNGVILTCTSFLLRWIGVLFNAYISNQLGNEGMGVYSLVQSVFGFAVTFSCSGINLGATRLFSEVLANNYWGDVKKVLKRCIIYALFFSLIAAVIGYFGANIIGIKILGDSRTVKSVRVLSFSLPFISLSSVFNGYFSAARRAYKNATNLILEQIIQIFVTVKLLSVFALKNIEYACVSVAIGILLSEIISFLYNITLHYLDFKKHKRNLTTKTPDLTKKLIKISFPLALSAYARSGLITIEHLLIPWGLRRNGVSYSRSMSTYGVIQGMVFPVIMFPVCVIHAFSGLLIPELATLNEKKEHDKINRTISIAIQYALYFSIGVSGIMMCYAYEISLLFYRSEVAYRYIAIFAPLVTIMYLDGVIDSILKGLNEQLHSMRINIADALISVLLVYILVPRFGLKGYIAAIFVCEIFNFSMSLIRLVKVSHPQISIRHFIIVPILSVLVSTLFVVIFFDLFKITLFTSEVNLILRIICTALSYTLFLNYNNKKITKEIRSY